MSRVSLNLRSDCGDERCEYFLDRWSSWCLDREGKELALLAIVPVSTYSRDVLDAKSRNMVVKAGRYFTYRVFDYNEELNPIHAINTSKAYRQGKPMTAAYREYPKPILQPWNLCILRHDFVDFGGYDEGGTLRAYIRMAVVGEIAIINQIMGHAEYLGRGVMNGLIYCLLQHIGREYPTVRFVNYLDLISCSEGLSRFKRSVGFETYTTHFVY